MKNKTHIRLFLLAIIVISSLILFAYSKNRPSDSKECSENSEKCEKKTQTDFIIWESLYRNLLSSR